MKWAGLPSEAIPPEADKSEHIPHHVHGSEAASHEAYEPLRVQAEPDSGAATHPEVAGDMMAEIDKRQLRLPLLCVLLGVSIITLSVGLILLIVHSC